MFLAFRFVIPTFFSSRGWEPWDIASRPLIPERMPVLVDDDPMFEDGPGAPRPVVAVNQWHPGPDQLSAELGRLIAALPRADHDTVARFAEFLAARQAARLT